jgi:hypothetical protein
VYAEGGNGVTCSIDANGGQACIGDADAWVQLPVATVYTGPAPGGASGSSSGGDGGGPGQSPGTGRSPRGFGTPDYYLHRYVSTTARYKALAQQAGREYLTGYGYKYAKLFQAQAEYTSSGKLKSVIGSILIELQVSLERGIRANPSLLDNPEALGRFAFDSHVDAYRRGGFGDLTLAEQVVFLNVVEGTKLLDYGIATGLSVAVRGLMMVNPPLPGLVPYPYQ